MSEENASSGQLDRLYRIRTLTGDFGRSTAEDIILHNRLYWANPLDFNDPMDCRPNLIFGRSRAEQKRWIQQAARNALGHRPRNERQRAIARMRRESPSALQFRLREIFESFISDSAICCFSKTANNLLLWSHYGDCHRGVCFVFDEILNEREAFVAFEVTYSDQRPEVNITTFGGNMQALQDSVLTKASDWDYEQEKRTLDYRKSAGLRDFPPSAFKGVILGARTSDDDKSFITSLLKQRGGDCKMWQADLSGTQFKLDINEIQFKK